MLSALERLEDRDRSNADAMLEAVAALRGLRFDGGVDQLSHALQCATLAERAGGDAELIVAALCHDVGKTFAPTNHSAVAAEMLAPFVRPEVVTMVREHEHVMSAVLADVAPDEIDRRHGELTRWFVAELDLPAQRPGSDAASLDRFAPIVRRVMGRPRFDGRVSRALSPPAVTAADGQSTVFAGDARAEGEHALERCVGDVDRFLRETWGQVPRMFDEREPFDDLLDERAISSFVRRHGTDPTAVRVVAEGVDVRLEQDLDVARAVTRAYERGATIALNGLERRWGPLVRFCRQIELFLSMPVQANAYVTPPGTRGLAAHTDDHDVIVLCTRGEKTFRIGQPAVEWTVRPGTAMYLPAGTRHVAVAGGVGSVHVTIGVHPTTWRSLVPGLLAALAAHPAAQSRLTPGHAYAGNQLAAAATEVALAWADWLASIGGVVLADIALDGFVRARPTGYGRSTPLAARALADALRAGRSLGPDAAAVRLRPGAIARLVESPQRARLTAGATQIDLPPAAARALRELLDGQRDGDALPVELVAALLEAGVIEPT